MTNSALLEKMANVFEASANYIDALEAQHVSLHTAEAQRKIAQENVEIESLVSAISEVNPSDETDLRSKLSASSPAARDVIRSLISPHTATDLGNVAEKRSYHVSYSDDPEAAFLNDLLSP